jgi:hypothetical protein
LLHNLNTDSVVEETINNKGQNTFSGKGVPHYSLKPQLKQSIFGTTEVTNDISYRYTSSWTDHVRNEEVLLRVSEQRNILHEIRKRKANWIGHILRRNSLLKQVSEAKIKGRIELTRRRGRRRKQLLDDLGGQKGYSHLKEEALDRIKWRNRFGRGFGPVV